MRRIVYGVVAGSVSALGVLAVSAAARPKPVPVAEPIVVQDAYEVQTDNLRRNETLSHMLRRHGITGNDLVGLLVVAGANHLDPRRITPRQEFAMRHRVGADAADRVRTRLADRDEFLELRRDEDGGWNAHHDPIEWIVWTELVTGTVEQSLNQAIHELVADSILPFQQREYLVWDVADEVFGWVIDFTRDSRPGDEFRILYERLTSSAGDVRYGRLLAASVQVAGRARTAYVLPGERNNNEYFDGEGRSLRRAFRMYPVAFKRISSGFGRRFHPVLQRYRSHLGTDFAADMGTPIRATADGVVRRAGRWGGYGIMVSVTHPKDIETRYAHMSRLARGIGAGVRVTQGQTIGYVGMTGLANGPHVHYEFLKNGRQVNYRSVDLGNGDPVPARRYSEFDSTRIAYDRLLGTTAGTVVAGN